MFQPRLQGWEFSFSDMKTTATFLQVGGTESRRAEEEFVSLSLKDCDRQEGGTRPVSFLAYCTEKRVMEKSDVRPLPYTSLLPKTLSFSPLFPFCSLPILPLLRGVCTDECKREDQLAGSLCAKSTSPLCSLPPSLPPASGSRTALPALPPAERGWGLSLYEHAGRGLQAEGNVRWAALPFCLTLSLA